MPNNSTVKLRLLVAVLAGLAAANAAAVLAQSRMQTSQMYKLAIEYERLGNYENAVTQFRRLFSQMPENASYYSGIKRNLERLGRYAELVRIVRKRLQFVDDIASRADLGDALFKNGEQDEAWAVWQDVLNRYHSSAGAYIQVAAAMQRNGLARKAIEIYLSGRAALKNDYLFAIELGNAYAATLQYQKATQELLRHLEQNPGQISYIERRILTLFKEDSQAEIFDEIELALRKHRAKELLRIKSSCLKKMKKYGDALSVQIELEKLKQASRGTRKNAGREVFNFAHEMRTLHEYGVAIKAYQFLLTTYPKTAYATAARLGYIETLQALGRYAEAIRALDEMISSSTAKMYDLKARLLKGEILLTSLNQPAAALAEYERVLANYKQHAAREAATLGIADAYFRLQDFGKAETWYQRALSLGKEKEVAFRNRVNFKLAELSFCRHRFQSAISRLERVEQLPTGSMKTNELFNDALEFIFLIEQNLQDSTAALRMYADYRCRSRRGDVSTAADTLQSLVDRYPAAALAPKALLDLATAYGELGQREKSRAALSQIVENYQSSIYIDEAIYRLGETFEADGLHREAISSYEKLLFDYPRSIYLEKARNRIRALREKNRI